MPDPVQELEEICGTDWRGIREAGEKTTKLVEQATSVLARFETPSASVVVTGSVGRREVTTRSDFDWILLVDGPSDPNHFVLKQEIGAALVEEIGIKPPGPTQTFGELVSSHDLVHYIAGTKDTNENLTRRVLLLLESVAITNPTLRETVIRNVLARYVIHDRGVPRAAGSRIKIPHFLLNDVVRYWRTIAADFASKMWERQHRGWGIRNIKLRFSRKLLFVAGLLTCFSAELTPHQRLDSAIDGDQFLTLLADLIAEHTTTPPLQKLGSALLPFPDLGNLVMTSYDRFLAMLDSEEQRRELEDLDVEDAAKSTVYANMRNESHAFRSGIDQLFFERDERLKQLIRRYGVF